MDCPRFGSATVAKAPPRLVSLNEQADFVRRQLGELGRWINLDGLDSLARDLAGHDDLKAAIEAAVRDVDFFRTKRWDSLLRFGLYRVTLYALTRALPGHKVIETGVLHGLSSIFILQGMWDNASDARLISIDRPSTFEDGPANRDGFRDTLPPEHDPGWIVPECYRRFWDLRLGRSSDLLAGALADLNGLNLFIHDSEHTDETMTFEFETVWPTLRRGGILLADNIDVNTAFFDFCRRRGRIPHVMPLDPDQVVPGGPGIRFGLIQK